MKILWLLCALAATACAQVRTVQVDAAKVTGTIRSFQGMNDGPAALWGPDVTKAYKDLRIDLVRTHDFFGPADIDAQWPHPDPIARMVKADGANSIFPKWDADPEKEESYNFGPSDRVIGAIVNCGAEVYYRVGRSWSADPAPPPDAGKFANIVRHVAMHYNGGWARGFQYKIRYWEFWNEPDLKKEWDPKFVQPFWTGTPEQFYALYEKVARALKSFDPGMKVGACGLAAGTSEGPYRKGLIEYCAAHKVPLDFYSWHHYHTASSDPYDMVRIAQSYRKQLDAAGFSKAETHVTEWGLDPNPSAAGPQGHASMEHAAFMGAAQVYLQDSKLDRSVYYRGDPGAMGLFEMDGSYRKKAYVYKALGAMLETPRRLASSGGDTAGFAVLAGRSADGKTVQVLIVNYEIPEAYRGPLTARSPLMTLERRTGIQYRDNGGYALTVSNLPWGKGEFGVKRYRISKTDNFARADETAGKGGTLKLSSDLAAPAAELIVLRRK
jgi:xylan 1,4-beta-xylosidase